MYSVGLTSVSMQWQAAGNSLDFVRLISSYGFKLRHAVTLLLGQGRALLQLTQGSLGARAMDSSSGMHELLSQYTNQPSTGSCGGRSRGRAGRSRQLSVSRAAIGMEWNLPTRGACVVY